MLHSRVELDLMVISLHGTVVIRPNHERVEDMKEKKHRSDMHKEAICLYVQEKAKPNGLTLRQVQEKILRQT